MVWIQGNSMGRHKDGKLEPRTKAHHDQPAFERHKKAKQDLHPTFSQQQQSTIRRPSRATRVLHSIGRVVMVTAARLLMMMRKRITESSQERERALIEIQMMIVVMRRLGRKRHLHFSTHLREDSQ
jgi:hypothetical protein